MVDAYRGVAKGDSVISENTLYAWDIETLASRLIELLEAGLISRDEAREILKLPYGVLPSAAITEIQVGWFMRSEPPNFETLIDTVLLLAKAGIISRDESRWVLTQYGVLRERQLTT